MKKTKRTPKILVSKIKAALAVLFIALAIAYAYLWVSDPPSPGVAASSSATSHCGNCDALCRTAAFDRAARIPDSLIQCSLSESTPGVALAVLRSSTGPRIWIVGDSMMVPAEINVLNAQGRDLRLGLVQEAQGRWPWLFDSAVPAGIGVVPPPPQALPSGPPTLPVEPTAAAAPQPPSSPWVLFATEEVLFGTFADTDPDELGDARAATQKELDGVLDWVASLWPTQRPWRHMAWVDPQCPHCLRLHEEGQVEHYAPRIVLNQEANPIRYQQALLSAGWLMGEAPDEDKFLAMEPADEVLSQQAADAQQQLDALLYQLRDDWDLVVPVQLLWDEGWIFIWLGAAPPPTFIPA